jgi:hypothetical protein
MEICDSKHGESCLGHATRSGRASKTARLFRPIYVERKTIKELTNIKLDSFKYVALSYVWGKDQKFKLNSTNYSQLLQKDFLVSLRPAQMIVDALLLTEKLSIPYIWVDALCIIQDDDNDKGGQLGMMADIYRRAYLTVIVASVIDADSGISGLRAGTSTKVQQQLVLGRQTGSELSESSHGPPISLFTTLRRSSHHFLEGTEWFKRGWTLQERALSSRTLAFTEERAY